MHTSLSKKLLAGLLSLVMVLSLVAPGTSAQAATKYSLTDKKSVKSGVTFKYELKGVSKGCYVKVTRNVSGEKVVYNKKELTKTTKVNGTGKTLNLYVTYGEKDENYTGKFTVRVYGKKTNKLYKTLVEEVTVKVPEKEEPQPEEPVVTPEVKSVEATGVKELTVTLTTTEGLEAKDVVVTKESAKPAVSEVKFDGTKAVITMGGKLTEGTYTVTVNGTSASVKVEDEKVSGFELETPNIIETYGWADATAGSHTQNADAIAEVYFYTLNQYGEHIVGGNISLTSVTSSFGATIAATAPTVASNYVGTLTFKTTNQLLTVAGTEITVVVVDTTTGATLNAKVPYSAKSTTSKIDVKGLYNTSKGKFMDMTANDTVGHYRLLFNAYDQYGHELNAAKAKVGLVSTTSAGLTNVTVPAISSVTDYEINDEAYLSLALSASVGTYANAGTFYLTIISNTKGTLVNTTFDVADDVIIKNLSLSPTDTLYVGTKTAVEYTATDTNGNEVTDYDVLKTNIPGLTSGAWSLEKQKDGSAKLFITPASNGQTVGGKLAIPTTYTVQAQPGTSNVVVKTCTWNVYPAKVATALAGFNKKFVTACANVSGTAYDYYAESKVKFNIGSIIVEDQFGNVLTTAEKNTLFGSATVTVELTANGTTPSGFSNVTSGTSYTTFMANNVNGTLYLVPQNTNAGYSTFTISMTGADVNATTSQISTKLYTLDTSKATGLAIASVNDDYPLYIVDETTSGLTVNDVEVTGIVDGKTVYVPTSQYVISGDTFKAFTTEELKDKDDTKAAKIEVTVDTVDGTKPVSTVLTADYSYSDIDPVLSYLASWYDLGYGNTVDGFGATIDAKDLINGFYYESQYGGDCSVSDIKYTIVDKTGTITVTHNNTNDVVISGTASSTVVFYVIATYGDFETTQEFTATFASANQAADISAIRTAVDGKTFATSGAAISAITTANTNSTCTKVTVTGVNNSDKEVYISVLYANGYVDYLYYIETTLSSKKNDILYQAP